VAYPRASLGPPGDRLPADTRAQAGLPVGVRFELVGDARALAIDCEARAPESGPRGEASGRDFALWRGGRLVAQARATVGRQRLQLPLGDGFAPDEPALLYLPEGMRPLVRELVGVEGRIAPAPAQPRWLCYGDSIAEGWLASGPAHSWVARAGREQGLDVVNLGYAGAARGELVSAEQIAALPADLVSVSHGTNCWGRLPHSAEGLRQALRDFLALLRQGQRETPIVCVSPLLRPQAEGTPNRLGATHAQLRAVFEEVVGERIAAGDARMRLVRGEALVAPEQLPDGPDGIHPDDAGHRALAAALGPELRAALSDRR
jgi:lysophospholipase L1-like esterase